MILNFCPTVYKSGVIAQTCFPDVIVCYIDDIIVWPFNVTEPFQGICCSYFPNLPLIVCGVIELMGNTWNRCIVI